MSESTIDHVAHLRKRLPQKNPTKTNKTKQTKNNKQNPQNFRKLY